MEKSNIILIGMPSSGKSTIGKYLADKMGMGFLDTDSEILRRENRPLREIVANDGLERFLCIQESTVIELDVDNHVIATGGSVVYGGASMDHLGEKGVIVFLNLSCEEIEARLAPERRLARSSGKSLEEMYLERKPLYEKYADILVDCSGKQVGEIAEEISNLIGKLKEGE